MPFIAPYLSTASREYSEHEGENLHPPGKTGERQYLYSFISAMRIVFMIKSRKRDGHRLLEGGEVGFG